MRLSVRPNNQGCRNRGQGMWRTLCKGAEVEGPQVQECGCRTEKPDAKTGRKKDRENKCDGAGVMLGLSRIGL